MKTKQTYLSLEEVGGNNLAPVTIEEGKSGGESGSRDTPENSLSDDTPPTGLRLVDGLVEEVIEEQRLKLAVLVVSGGDVTKENTLNDTSSTPHLSNTRVVQVPAELKLTSESWTASI